MSSHLNINSLPASLAPASQVQPVQQTHERPLTKPDEISPIAKEAIKKGWHAHQTGQYAEAIKHYSLLLDGKLKNKSIETTALFNRLLCHLKLSQWPEVIADSFRLLGMDPKPESNILLLGRIARAEAYCHQKKWGLTVLESTNIICMDPETPKKRVAQAYLIRGLAHENQGNWDEADLDYSQVIKLNPEDYNRGVQRALIFRGVVRVMNGNRAAGLEDLHSVDFESVAKDIHPAFLGLMHAQITKARSILSQPPSSVSVPQEQGNASVSQTSPSKKRSATDVSTQNNSRRRKDDEGLA